MAVLRVFHTPFPNTFRDPLRQGVSIYSCHTSHKLMVSRHALPCRLTTLVSTRSSHVVRNGCFACFSNQIEADLGVLRTQVCIFPPPTRFTRASSSNDMHLPRVARRCQATGTQTLGQNCRFRVFVPCCLLYQNILFFFVIIKYFYMS